MQFSFAFNKATEKVGFNQVSPCIYFAEGGLKGLQLSGIANVTKGKLDGLQLGTVNIAQTLDGMQLSVLNLAQEGLGSQIGTANILVEDFKGFQLGSLNLTGGSMAGVQIGVVNWADDLNGVQIGVLNATAKELAHTGTWVDETGMGYFTFTTGARWWYSYYAIGYSPYVDEEPYSFGGGMGGHIKLNSRMFMEIDLGAMGVTSEAVRVRTADEFPGATFGTDGKRPWNTVSRLRMLLSARLAKGVTLCGGATVNVLAKENEDPVLIRPRGSNAKRVNNNVEMWPWSMAGIRFGRS